MSINYYHLKITSMMLFLILCVLLSSCASQPDELRASYVSPLKYKDYDCEQINLEMTYLSNKTNELYTQLKKKADDDQVQMGIGLVLFWPALFFVEGGDGPEAQEYSRLKGEFEALRSASVQKKCMQTNTPLSPEEIMNQKAKEEKKQKANNS